MSPKPSVTLVIPARFASTRFPGKPLALLAGKPLIRQAYERAAAAGLVAQVLVATDDARIREAVEGFGGKVVMTERALRTGTDRVAEVARGVAGDVFVNLQGDELPLDPALIDDLVRAFVGSRSMMGTLKRPLADAGELASPDIVKVVTTAQGEALYFSRAPIPLDRDGPPGRINPGLHYGHLGIYIYTRETLQRLAELPTGRLEDIEKLEQLRALEHGIPIRVWETTHPSLRIDRPEDLEAAASRLDDVHTLADAEG